MINLGYDIIDLSHLFGNLGNVFKLFLLKSARPIDLRFESYLSKTTLKQPCMQFTINFRVPLWANSENFVVDYTNDLYVTKV
jgi:hypothetical protein